MKRRQRKTCGILIFIAVITIAIIGWIYYGKHTYTVEMRPDGFHPTSLTISQGSTVVFRTKGVPSFWPASNFHPSHRLLPAFDAAAPQTGSWSMTFNDAGIWRYHDHLRSQMTGVIIVRRGVMAKDPCNGATDTSGPDRRQRCYIQRIERVLAARGLEEAFAEFGLMYESAPWFVSDCHDITHLLGEAAYRAYAQNGTVVTSVKTSACGYGFYHGFIEALLFTTGQFDTAKAYCRSVQRELSRSIVTPNAIYACYHGLGHGTFDTQSSQYWGDDEGMVVKTLAVCGEVTQGDEPELQKQCATGVFNALANAYANGTYQLVFPAGDVLGICKKETKPEFRRACVMEVGTAYLQGMEDMEQKVRFIANLPVSDGQSLAYGFFADETRRAADEFLGQEFEVICRQLPEAVAGACIGGTAAGLFLWGQPGREHERALAFCETLAGRFQDACFGEILPKLISIYPRDRIESVCRGIEPAYRGYCL